MPNPLPWTERTFNFDFSHRLAGELIARIDGMPARVAELVQRVRPADLTRRTGDTWSIQENIAHLTDTDQDLFIPRLDQFEQGVEELLPADMTNRRTWGSDHNARSIGEVLTTGRDIRAKIVARLDAYPLEYFERSALHPRLKQPMRVIDLVYFKAEHDDYHIARIRELVVSAIQE